MSKSSGGPLARLLDTPNLSRVVPQLAPETLHALIRHSGLEACGEIVVSATPAQLACVLDLDLWQNARPGHDERFDPDRFGEWLELLADAGGTVAARTVAALDENLVLAGLSRHVRVIDPAALGLSASTDDEVMEREFSHEGPACELGGYLVCARRADGWDAIVAVLQALEDGHPDHFHAVMQGVRRLSNSTPEVDGLDDLLLEPEQRLHDAAIDRERRRSRQGYSTPADARAFLQMARRRSPGAASVNPIAAAYFRAADDEAASSDALDLPRGPSDPPALAGASEALDAVVETLAEAGLEPEHPRALLEGSQARASRLARIRLLMESVRDRDPAAYLARGRELAFLANTLVAGCSIQSRSFTPQEASDAAVSVCQLGLEHWSVAHGGETMPATFLIDHDLVNAFEVGWTVLHDEVSMFAAEELIGALSDLRCGGADIQEGLDALRIELARQRATGTPWRARDALEVIAMLDLPAWAGLLGLLDECPVIPAALTAAVEGRTGAVSATDFELISTRSQLGTVREFLARLPDTLRGGGREVGRSRVRRKRDQPRRTG